MMSTLETHGLPKVEKKKRTAFEIILEHVTTVTHVLLLGLSVYIIWLVSSTDTEVSMVTGHVILGIAGWTFLMNESVLCLSEHNVFTKYIEYKKKVKIHMFFFAFGFGLVGGGFAIMITHFVIEKRSHFSTTHGILGLVVMVFGTVTYFNSFAVYYHVKLEKYINPDWNKLVHAVVGAVTLILGSAATITGLYTAWFKNRAGGSYKTVELCLAIMVVTGVWTLLQPVLRNYKRIKSMTS